MKIGKLDNDLLRKIVIDKIRFRRPEVKVRPGVGDDCAVVDFGDYDLIVSTDPITAASDSIGGLAVHISCNDIATNGVAPLGLLLTVLLPPATTEEQIGEIMAQAAEAAEALGVEIIGGHTEITDVVKHPVISSTAIGRKLVAPQGAAGAGTAARSVHPGDRILVTKKLALEGTAIIATEHEDKIKAVLSNEELVIAKKMLEQISVVAEGVAVGKVGFSAMHDITEGGVLGAVWEVCHLHGVGAEVLRENLPVDSVTEKICEHLGINPFRLISSGSMLIFATPENAREIEDALAFANIEVTDIGVVLPKDAGTALVTNGQKKLIEPPGPDEIYKVITR
jgi:hydrogenase expression/formation protein HypE